MGSVVGTEIDPINTASRKRSVYIINIVKTEPFLHPGDGIYQLSEEAARHEVASLDDLGRMHLYWDLVRLRGQQRFGTNASIHRGGIGISRHP